MNESVQFWVTISAIVIGPISAVLVTQFIQRWREQRDRRLQVFRVLMQSRRNCLGYDHVAALNLVEIEFHGIEKVLKPFEQLVGYFQNGIVRRDGEEDDVYFGRRSEHHAALLTALLSEMGRHLGYSYGELKILQGGYSPEFHGQIEEHQDKARRLLAEIYEGRRSLPIAVIDYRSANQILEAAREANEILSSAQSEGERLG